MGEGHNQRGWFSFSSAITADHERAIAQAFKHYPNRNWARKVIISRDAKAKILRSLWLMNITGEAMFRGLDGLGRAMAELPLLFQPENNVTYAMAQGLLVTEGNKQDMVGVPTSEHRH